MLDIYDLQHALFGAPTDMKSRDDPKKVIPDTPIPMQLFSEFDGEFDVQVLRFRGQRAQLEDVDFVLEIQETLFLLKILGPV